MEFLSDVIYRIKRDERTKPKVVHINRLLKYCGRGQYTLDQHHLEPDITDRCCDNEEICKGQQVKMLTGLLKEKSMSVILHKKPLNDYTPSKI